MSQLEELLQQCTVQLTIPGQPGWGTGFFVAPGLILTCAHVVKALTIGAAARIRWQQSDFATAELVQLVPNYDLALLQCTPPNAALPCVYLDEALQTGQELYFFGYPDRDFDNGCPVTGNCEGFTGDVPPLIKFKQAQVRPGMSGAALLNRYTGKVCGMVKFTRDRSIDLGGGAIPTRVILEQFPHLREFQREFHQRDRRWQNLITTRSEVDFQLYLESILNNEDYREWQEVYTPTKVEDRQRLPTVTLAEPPQPRFSRRLKLRVETVKPPESEHQRTEAPDRQEKVEQLDVLAGLRKYALEHVLLVGKPGSGKSTSLERLLWEEADQALKQAANAKIPVLVKLRRCTGTIEVLIQDFCRSHQLPLTLAEIETLLDQGKLLLLLDGLNELPETFRTTVANFRDRYRATTPMIVSTRELSIGGNLGIAKTLKMLPLTEPQMQEFVRGYLGQEGNRLLQQIKGDRLRKFAETPLLLWMLCRVFAENNRVPANLGLAFREFTQLYDAEIQQDAPAASREQWSKLLRHLAFALMHDQAPTAFRLSMSREEAADLLTTCLQQEGRANARDGAERGLKDLLSYHLIQPAMQPNYEEHIEFRHQLIQEYYAAEYLLRILPTLSDEQLQREYLNYLKWTEPIALMLAMVEEQAHALRVVQMALGVDWKLGAKLAGKVALDFQAATVGEVIALPVADWLKVELLGQTQSEVEIPELLSFLKHPNINIAEIAASYVGETQNQEVIDILAKRLEEISIKFFSQKSWGGPDKTGILWTTHVRAFAYLSPQVATQFLLDKLGKHDTLLLMTTDAASILMQLDVESIIQELLKDFQNAQQEEKRKLAADIQETEVEIQMPELFDLGIHSESAMLPEEWRTIKFTPPSPESLKRNHILNLLENSSDYELFVPTLIEAFEQEPDESIQGQIIQILAKSQYDAAIHLLVQKLAETNGNLRSEAAKQLIKQKSIDNLNSLEALHKLVYHEDWNISWCAAIVLGHLKDSTVLPRMMYELENHQIPSIRSTAARVLGIIGNPNCVPSLLKAINQDTDRYVQLDAACSLSSFGQKEAIPILLDALKSPTNADPHSGIMKSISRFCIKEPLLNIVRSKRLYWQRAAVELGRLSKSQRDDKFIVLPDLFDALVDPGHESSKEIINLLSELADSEILNCLIDALEHPEKYTSDIYFPNRVAHVLVRCCPEMMVNKLVTLKNLSTRNYISQLFWLIPTIQNRCKLLQLRNRL
jgi:HEAT repeat protein